MELMIIPQPAFIKPGNAFFKTSGLFELHGDSYFDAELRAARPRLAEAALRTGITEQGSSAKLYCRRETHAEGRPLGSEAYRLVIAADHIDIYAAEPAGAHHALESLRQLVLSGGVDGQLVIPCAEIIDSPRFGWRGYMLDTARHFYPAAFIKKMLDLLSLHHINIFHWHLTDDQGWRFNVPEYPRLGEIGSRRRNIQSQQESWSGALYTDAEITGIVEYAASLHIQIVPEADFPGHASAILAAYPEFGCTGGPYQVEDRHGIFPDVLCAGNDHVFELTEAVFNTLCRLFPSQYIHIGGDEVPAERWEACPRCKERLGKLGLAKAGELQSWFTSRFAETLQKHGKTIIGWDEILDCASSKHPLPPQTVIMSWRGREGGLKAAEAGYPVIMTPNTDGCYLDYRHLDDTGEPGAVFGVTTLAQSYHHDPQAGMSSEAAKFVLGGQGNLWSELTYADKLAEYMSFPRMCALAETFWSPAASKDFDRFKRSLTVHQKRLDILEVMQFRRW